MADQNEEPHLPGNRTDFRAYTPILFTKNGNSVFSCSQRTWYLAASDLTNVHFLTRENPAFHFVDTKTNIYAVNDKYIFPSNTFVCVTAPRQVRETCIPSPASPLPCPRVSTTQHLHPLSPLCLQHNSIICSGPPQKPQCFFL